MSTNPARTFLALPLAFVAAASVPSLLAYNLAPSASFLNQALAVLLWAWVATACALDFRLTPPEARRSRSAWLLPGAGLLLLLLAAIGSHGVGHLPRSLAWLAAAVVAAAMVLLGAGARAGAAAAPQARLALSSFAIGWLLAGLLSTLIAFVQVFAPQWADGSIVARGSVAGGRAIGNLRQANHLGTLLLWAVLAAVALQEWGSLRRWTTLLLLGLLAAGAVLTGSRTSALGLGLLALWGLLDRRLSLPTRASLMSLPVLYGVSWAVLSWWASSDAKVLGAELRLTETDVSSSRFAIWAEALELIRRHPWTGIGFGEFNFAWTLTEFPNRPRAFFDHTHNLFVQWAVELGLPVAAVLSLCLATCALRMLLAVWRAPHASESAKKAVEPTGEPSFALRLVLALLSMMFLHSLLEYPLWYAYFLLPTAWLLGYGLAQAAALQAQAAAAWPVDVGGRPRRGRLQRGHAAPVLALSGLLCAGGAILSIADYRQVAAIYTDRTGKSLQERLKQGLRSPLFAHQAAYAAATTSDTPEREMDALRQAAHSLLDTRLMIAWAKAYAASGDLPRALYLVARLREFGSSDAAEFFSVCTDQPAPPSAAAPPFQCLAADPRVVLHWTHFR